VQETCVPPAFTLVSCSAYFFDPEDGGDPPKRRLTLNGLHGVISQKMVFCNLFFIMSFILLRVCNFMSIRYLSSVQKSCFLKEITTSLPLVLHASSVISFYVFSSVTHFHSSCSSSFSLLGATPTTQPSFAGNRFSHSSAPRSLFPVFLLLVFFYYCLQSVS
jgi:hypothetical protein